MDNYLTTKVTPNKMTVLMEVIAVLVTGSATLLWLAVAVFGLVVDGFYPAAHLMIVLLALPWALVLFFVLRRWYDRSRAKRIVSLLCTKEQGAMTCGELTKAGVYAPEKAIAKLTARKYIRNVVEVHGEVRLVNRAMTQVVCAYCGGSLLLRAGADKCPCCGANTIKY